ncbi:Transposon Ty3-G Gag-Pol polyprotein [Smittium culicis]|uniref:Transposon Ty3-G Gag-Pol polyprotein n=1 Tax=Smittium culicis TaxID=133412 RepID=A0A1R1YHK0_9FUNG|nr:Transposon Ty3-G Gag-Pol polyprotein [Smittium culicis]
MDRKRRLLEPTMFSGKEESDAEEWIDRYELYAKKEQWSDEDKMELIELYLDKKERYWFRSVKKGFKTWKDVRQAFLDKFVGKEQEIKAWRQLQEIRMEDFADVEDFEIEIQALFSKAKITDSTVQWRCLMSSLNPKYQRIILREKIVEFDKAMTAVKDESELYKLVDSHKYGEINSTEGPEKNRQIVTNHGSDFQNMYEAIITGFDKLSINMISLIKDNLVGNMNQHQQPRYNDDRKDFRKKGACYICDNFGHRSYDCPEKKQKTENFISTEGKNSTGVKTESNNLCIELENGVVEENLNDLFALEKRNRDGKDEDVGDRNKIQRTVHIQDAVQEQIVDKLQKATIRAKKIYDIKMAKDVEKYSIKGDLAELHPNINFIQLLQTSPKVRSELLDLCRRVEVKPVDNLENSRLGTSNCKAVVKIFGEYYWSVIDTGAACSVMSDRLMKKLGLEPDIKVNKLIVTADGTKHESLGIVSKVPLKIAGYTFNADFLVMSNSKNDIILGTEWFKQHKVVIDLNKNEMIMPKDKFDVILSMENSDEGDLGSVPEDDEIEFFALAKEVMTVDHEEEVDPRVAELVKTNKDIFVSDIRDLTQTDIVEHTIDTGDAKPVKLRPYRIPHNMQKIVREEIRKMEEKGIISACHLSKDPILAHPNWDLDFILTTDASISGLGAILSQIQGGKERVIAYASRALSKHESNYSITNLEGLGVVWSIKKFHHFLWGRRFQLKTDHSALIKLFSEKEVTGRLARWSMILRQYDFEIIAIKGKNNPSDCLSRLVDEKLPSNLESNNKRKYQEIDINVMDTLYYYAIVNYLKDFSYPKDADESFRMKLRNKSRLYKVKDGVLFKKSKKNNESKEVLHEINAKDAILRIHNDAHEGINNTWKRVSDKYTGAKLYELVKDVVEECDLCQRYSNKNQRNHQLVPIISKKPFDIVGIDAIGPIQPITKSGNRYILTAVDYFSKWPIALAVPNINSSTVINFLLDCIVKPHGVPRQLISDRGSNFLSQETTEFYEYLGIRHTPTTSYRPQSNGQVERLNQTLKNILAKQTHKDKDNWDLYIWKSLLIIRTMKNTSTKYSPSELLYGYNITLPSNYRPPAEQENFVESVSERYQSWMFKFPQIRAEGLANIIANKEKVSEKYNIGVNKREYSTGQKVLKKVDSGNKFEELWEGPYNIDIRLQKGAYIISDSAGNRDIVHGDRLIEYKRSEKMVPEVIPANLRSTLKRFKTY